MGNAPAEAHRGGIGKVGKQVVEELDQPPDVRVELSELGAGAYVGVQRRDLERCLGCMPSHIGQAVGPYPVLRGGSPCVAGFHMPLAETRVHADRDGSAITRLSEVA